MPGPKSRDSADRLQAQQGASPQGRALKRDDQTLESLPIGVIVFPGSGISANLADKARMMGVPVWKFSEGGA